MFFHAPAHVYLVYFNREIIVLNLKKNEYNILPKEISEVLAVALANEFNLVNNKYVLSSKNVQRSNIPYNFNKYVRYLRDVRILCQRNYERSWGNLIGTKTFSAGAPNVDWHIKYGDLNIKVTKKLIFKAYFTLIKVYCIIKLLGFHGLIKTIKKKQKKYTGFIKKTPEEFNSLVAALNRACFYFPVKTKCLE